MLCSPLAVQPSLFTQFFVINCRVRNKVKHIQTVLGDWLQKFKNTFISSRARPRYAERLRDKQYFRINFRIRELTWRTFPVRQALHFPWALAISERFIITKVTRHHCCKVSFYHYGEGFNKLIFKQEGIRIWQPGRKSTKLVGVLSIMPKIPEISVGIQMERSVSVSSDRNIRDHLWRWSTYFGRNIPTEIRRSILDKPVLCPN